VELLTTRAELRALDRWRGGRPLVLVPTMGALHVGHLALVRRAAEIGVPVASIFVNPQQFGPQEDFSAYPRDLEGDLALLEPLDVAAVFAPAVSEIYGEEEGVSVRPGSRAGPLCGASRPGHFAGVLTVVAKLFNLVRPDVAIFGRKDAQQCLVIAQMVEDLDFPIRVIDHPTVREPDGLALSSRNRYLDAGERQRALALWRALQAGESCLLRGERDPGAVREAMSRELEITDAVEYVEVLGVPDLQAPERVAGRTLLAIAVRVGRARLIDNLVLDVTVTGARPCGLIAADEEATS